MSNHGDVYLERLGRACAFRIGLLLLIDAHSSSTKHMSHEENEERRSIFFLNSEVKKSVVRLNRTDM